MSWKPFFYGGVASCAAELVTFPIDTTKIRLQIQGQHTKEALRETKYSGMTDAFVKIVREEGMLRLYRGIIPALLRQSTYGTLKLGIYDNLRKTLFQNEREHTPAQHVFTAAIAGAISSAIASPTDRIKIRMQSHGELEPYKGVIDAVSKIVKTEGWVGLYHGVGPTSQRAAIVAGVELPVYSQTKKFLLGAGLEDTISTHFLAGTVAGFCSCMASNPIDVVKSRVMNEQKRSGEKLYSGSLDCLRLTVKYEGVRALYRGFIPTYLRQGPWNIMFFLTYEQLKIFV